MPAAITGLAALLHTSALAFQVLTYLGVAYLLHMAWSTLREHGALRVGTDAAPRTGTRVVASGIRAQLRRAGEDGRVHQRGVFRSPVP